MSPQTLELKHDFAEVESLMKERKTKPSEEVVEAFKGAADHERREHQGVQSHAIGDAVTEVGQSQTQVKEGGYKGRSEYREQGEFKPEVIFQKTVWQYSSYFTDRRSWKSGSLLSLYYMILLNKTACLQISHFPILDLRRLKKGVLNIWRKIISYPKQAL